MNLTHTDTVAAFQIEKGDVIERVVDGKHVHETVTDVLDDGGDILVFTDMTDPEEPWSLDAFETVELYGYVSE